jgi:Undecaprenyl-phosphate glucose phosphotransferase
MTSMPTSHVSAHVAVEHGAPICDCAPPAATKRLEGLLVRLVVIEYLIIAGTCYLTSLLYYDLVLGQWPPHVQYITSGLVIATLALLSALGFRQYVTIQAQSSERFVFSAIAVITLAFSLFLSILFVFKIADWYSRGTFSVQFVGVTFAVLATRGIIHYRVRLAAHSGRIQARRAVIIGDSRVDPQLLKNLEFFGIRCTGFLPLPATKYDAGPARKLATVEIREVVDRCRALQLDDIIFVTAAHDLPRVSILADALADLSVTVHVIPTGMAALWTSAQIASLGDIVTIQILRPPLSRFDLALKRIFDIFVASISIALLAPLFCCVALAIKLESEGPIFFRQNRHGYNNQIIPILKFRTMNVVEDGETTATFTQAKAHDPRITRVGRILRRSNIDELPQFFNILRGEMSVVGPRPHPIALNATFQERIAPLSRRHKVKPGLTGWAQVHGFRGQTDTIEKMQRRVEHDLFYIDNWSFLLDIKIIIMTLFSRNAYINAG